MKNLKDRLKRLKHEIVGEGENNLYFTYKDSCVKISNNATNVDFFTPFVFQRKLDYDLTILDFMLYLNVVVDNENEIFPQDLVFTFKNYAGKAVFNVKRRDYTIERIQQSLEKLHKCLVDN